MSRSSGEKTYRKGVIWGRRTKIMNIEKRNMEKKIVAYFPTNFISPPRRGRREVKEKGRGRMRSRVGQGERD